METTQIIHKEKLSQMLFSKLDVLGEKDARQRRSQDLNYALQLGNVDHTKVKILFTDKDGFQNQVESTIWAVTEESVCLKGCLYIPIQAILKVEY